MDESHQQLQKIIELENRLWVIYKSAANGKRDIENPAFPCDQEFENWFTSLSESFPLINLNNPSERIGILLSFLTDTTCVKWIPSGQFNPKLHPHVDELKRLVFEAIPDDEELRIKRIPEFVIAYLNRWKNKSEGRMLASGKAKSIFIQCIEKSIEVSFDWLDHIKQRLPQHLIDQRMDLAQEIYFQICQNINYCHCCLKEKKVDLAEEVINEKKMTSLQPCILRHKISSWNPNWTTTKSERTKTESLWFFLQTATKGSAGSFKPGSFRSGILRKTLKYKYSFDIQWASIAVKTCPHCKGDRKMMVKMRGQPIAEGFKSRTLDDCIECGNPLPKNAPILAQPGLLIPNAPYRAKRVFSCPECEHHYEPNRCLTKSACDQQANESHDSCPRDKVPHSMGPRLLLHTLYLFDKELQVPQVENIKPEAPLPVAPPLNLPEKAILNYPNDFSESMLNLIELLCRCVNLKQNEPFCRLLPIFGQKPDWEKLAEIISKMSKGGAKLNAQELKKDWEESHEEIFSLLTGE